MKPDDRQLQILSRIRAMRREWRVDELAASLNVSPLTIRRDLDQLVEEGTVLRTHGGCIYAGRVAMETGYHQRVANHFELKQAIGAAAAAEVQAGDVILISDGSTCFHLASHLGKCGPVTVYTNSLTMCAEVNRFPNVTLRLLGGEVQRDQLCLGGGMLDRALDVVEFDTVFLGADKIDAAGRCLVVDEDVARTAQIMLRRSKRAILLADHTKLGGRGHVVYGALPNFNLWITSKGLPPEVRGKLARITTIKEVNG